MGFEMGTLYTDSGRKKFQQSQQSDQTLNAPDFCKVDLFSVKPFKIQKLDVKCVPDLTQFQPPQFSGELLPTSYYQKKIRTPHAQNVSDGGVS